VQLCLQTNKDDPKSHDMDLELGSGFLRNSNLISLIKWYCIQGIPIGPIYKSDNVVSTRTILWKGLSFIQWGKIGYGSHWGVVIEGIPLGKQIGQNI
jgi:hypothetical protein